MIKSNRKYSIKKQRKGNNSNNGNTEYLNANLFLKSIEEKYDNNSKPGYRNS